MNKRIQKKLERPRGKQLKIILEFNKNNHINNWDELPQWIRDFIKHQAKKRARGQRFIKRPNINAEARRTMRIIKNNQRK